MARIRCIKPEFWTDEQVADCSTNARLSYIGLWNFADDQGVHPAKPKTLKAELFPMDDCSAVEVAGWISELIRAGLVVEFESDGEAYWHVAAWSRDQKIDRPSCKYPTPPAKNSKSVPRSVDDDSSNARRAPPPGREGKGRERKGVDGSSPKARRATSIPTNFGVSDGVRRWAASKGFDRLDEHLEAFVGKVTAHAYTYTDWDSAFMNAIRDDWARLRTARNGAHSTTASLLHSDDNLAGAAT